MSMRYLQIDKMRFEEKMFTRILRLTRRNFGFS